MTQQQPDKQATNRKAARKSAENDWPTDDEKKPIWIVGDKYHEEATFEDEMGAISDKSRLFLGGTWYVMRFLEKIVKVKSRVDIQLSTYDPLRDLKEETRAATHTFKRCSSRPPDDAKEKLTETILRIKNTNFKSPPTMVFDNQFKNENPKLLVIEDMGMGYRAEGAAEWTSILERMKVARSIQSSVDIVVLLGGDVPDFDDKAKTKKQNALWKTLAEKHRDNTLVIVNADLLRFVGADISRRISWERTAHDLVKALESNPRINFLQKFAHVIVRFGVTACVHCYSILDTRIYQLFYDTKAHDGIFRDASVEGGIIGNNSIYTAYVVEQLAVRLNSIGIIEKISRALTCAIPACQQLYREGYPLIDEKTAALWMTDWPNDSVFTPISHSKLKHLSNKSQKFHATCPELVRQTMIPAGVDEWTILEQSSTGKSLMRLAELIVLKGVKGALNIPSSIRKTMDSGVHAPIARFGDITTVDRNEIESFRGVANVVNGYLQSSADTRPLNIAVFGPPGSGKSTLVRELINECNHAASFKLHTINLAQMTDPDTLSNAIAEKIDFDMITLRKSKSKAGSTGPSPHMIFFDEFDCDYGGSLGWLKLLLPLMEDGKFAPKGKTIQDIGRCILFFAGGTKYNYNAFACNDPSINDSVRRDFALAKGPDFVSRLRGYLNIKGVNRLDSSDKAFILRRAIVIRDNFQKAGLFGKQLKVDYSVIKALLRVREFKHGARSIRAILDMSSVLWGRVEKASLPADRLLDMHLDSVEFRALISDYNYQKGDPLPQTQFYIMS